jgi:hypothetical protein
MDHSGLRFKLFPSSLIRSTADKPVFKAAVDSMLAEWKKGNPDADPSSVTVELTDSQAMALGQSDECQAYLKAADVQLSLIRNELHMLPWGVPSAMYGVGINISSESVGDWSRLLTKGS